MEHVGKRIMRFEKHVYALVRIVVGFLFFQHGAQKLFAWFGAQAPAEAMKLFWWAGVIEVVVGLALVLGLFTRLFAILGAVQMAVAYFMVHAGNGIWPIVNRGEPAVLFFAIFLLIAVYGAKELSLEKMLLKKEIF